MHSYVSPLMYIFLSVVETGCGRGQCWTPNLYRLARVSAHHTSGGVLLYHNWSCFTRGLMCPIQKSDRSVLLPHKSKGKINYLIREKTTQQALEPGQTSKQSSNWKKRGNNLPYEIYPVTHIKSCENILSRCQTGKWKRRNYSGQGCESVPVIQNSCVNHSKSTVEWLKAMSLK